MARFSIWFGSMRIGTRLSLAFATVLTLVFLPVLYCSVYRINTV